jgi:hypothetical protein
VLLGDFVFGLCFGRWFDLAVGFSFGGVVFSITWMLVCFGELVDVGVGFLYSSRLYPSCIL